MHSCKASALRVTQWLILRSLINYNSRSSDRKVTSSVMHTRMCSQIDRRNLIALHETYSIINTIVMYFSTPHVSISSNKHLPIYLLQLNLQSFYGLTTNAPSSVRSQKSSHFSPCRWKKSALTNRKFCSSSSLRRCMSLASS